MYNYEVGELKLSGKKQRNDNSYDEEFWVANFGSPNLTEPVDC